MIDSTYRKMQMKLLLKLLFLFLAVFCFSQNICAQQINAAEYFWDVDPGEGNATAMSAVDGNFNNALEKILANTSALPASGVHSFNMRVKDGSNKWSKPFKTIIDITPAIVSKRAVKVSLAEYFWDTDPGQGNATLLLAFDGAYDQALETVFQSGIALPSVGIHKFFMRVHDAENHWGPAFSTIVNITPSLLSIRQIKVSTAECFWDNDPGFGNGIAMLAFDGAYNEAVEVLIKNGINLPANGIHKFNVRVRDAENKWGNTFGVVVDITPSLLTSRAIKIIAAEYFFDVDPGNGNATPMLAFDGNFNSAIESIKGGNIPSPVLMGKHVLYLRVKSASGQWGSKFGIVVNMDIDIDNFTTDINGPTALCYSTVFNNAYVSAAHSGNTYSWSITGGTITSGAGTNAVTVNWTFTGIHKLILTECNSLGTVCSTDSILVSVSPPTSQTVNRFICGGDSLFLQGAWRKNAGLYRDSLQSIGGCDSIVNTNLALYPTYNLAASAGFCTGQSVVVGGVSINLPGIYTQNFLTINGCDSTVVTTVSEYPVSIVNTNANICTGDSIYLQGAYRFNPGTFTDVLVSSFGCDSVVVTQLFVNQPSSSTQSIFICSGDSVFLGGAYQTLANTYVDVIPNFNNCDSTITTTLNLWPSYIDTLTAVINQGDSIFLAGNYQFTSGYYTDTLSTTIGCDSILVTSLSVLIGTNNLSNFENDLLVYPNPFDQQILFKSTNNKALSIFVVDASGKRIFVKEEFNDNEFKLNTENWPPGVYMMAIQSGQNLGLKKIIKLSAKQ